MRARLAVFAVLLCALPASGDGVQLSDDQVDALTQIDTAPTRAQIDLGFGASGLASLVAIAKDAGKGLDLQLRAIRALPQYCATPICSGEPHDSLSGIINGYLAALPGALSPRDMLRLRAAIEALGATRWGSPAMSTCSRSRSCCATPTAMSRSPRCTRCAICAAAVCATARPAPRTPPRSARCAAAPARPSSTLRSTARCRTSRSATSRDVSPSDVIGVGQLTT